MRLTDEKIRYFARYKMNTRDRRIYTEGAEEARYFYENQKCETCRETDNGCLIKIYLLPGLGEYKDATEETAGCSHWEPKK